MVYFDFINRVIVWTHARILNRFIKYLICFVHILCNLSVVFSSLLDMVFGVYRLDFRVLPFQNSIVPHI